MQGDMNRVLGEVNVILEDVFKRIEALEDRCMRLEVSPQPDVAKKATNRANKATK